MELQDIIEMLREFWQQSRNTFEFNASMLLAGDNNKQRRRLIIEQLTGKTLPMSKCSYHATIQHLENSFSQPTLF